MHYHVHPGRCTIPGSRLLMPLRAGPYIYCDFRRDSNASYLGIIQIAETQPNVE